MKNDKSKIKKLAKKMLLATLKNLTTSIDDMMPYDVEYDTIRDKIIVTNYLLKLLKGKQDANQ